MVSNYSVSPACPNFSNRGYLVVPFCQIEMNSRPFCDFVGNSLIVYIFSFTAFIELERLKDLHII